MDFLAEKCKIVTGILSSNHTKASYMLNLKIVSKITRKLKHFCIFGFLACNLFFTVDIYADPSTTPNQNTSIAVGLKRILNAQNYPANIGIYVQSLKTGRVYFSKNAYGLFAPASIQKLITVSAALLFLKPTFQFATTLQSPGAIDGNVLNGNLYLRFSGDPSLKRSDLFALFSALKAQCRHACLYRVHPQHAHSHTHEG